MAKRRRKLNKEMEKDISRIKRKIEFINAIINDITEDDLQEEYRSAFQNPQNVYVDLCVEYDTNGFTQEAEELMRRYNQLIIEFEEEFEI